MKDTLVLYPALGKGHLNSMIELGKFILTHNPSLSISILILSPPNTTVQPEQEIQKLITTFGCESLPSITFHHIPPISFPVTLPPHILPLEVCSRSNHHANHILQSISKSSNLKGVILDFMNYSTNQITSTLDIPTYFFYTSGAASLAVFLQLPSTDKMTTKSLKEFHMHPRIPGLPPIPIADMPDESKHRESKTYKVFLDMATIMKKSDGIIVNTFEAIEGRALKALKAGLCLPEGETPPIFCIGPMISPPLKGEDERGSLCLKWLDLQPSKSVLFLCFGSMGRFSKVQLKEIAIGLEKSEQRFLWIVRSDIDSEKLSLDELLPEGFLERTKEKGMVVRNWAPQTAILSHDSVGGFVTHCGWNSMLEAICVGVPMIAWPMYAEQRLNRLFMVEEMKVGLQMNESNGLISATELGERAKELMESHRGIDIRERILKMKISAKEARGGGGSSLIDLKKLVDSWSEHASNNGLSPNTPFLFR
ncbi:UDP-glycosyltransferase 1-like [Trifolium pratense]|uniref:UDP-glycosyltransferase 1-like n=1 Tax=Trifolium pratense TaxID=57577 RepID=UPI001E6918B6|nr:UDP-glycosyltransferase 1-like [Trifolium pratense]